MALFYLRWASKIIRRIQILHAAIVGAEEITEYVEIPNLNCMSIGYNNIDLPTFGGPHRATTSSLDNTYIFFSSCLLGKGLYYHLFNGVEWPNAVEEICQESSEFLSRLMILKA